MTFQAVRNVGNRWEPELKRLHDNLTKIEESLAGTDDCVLDIYSLEETHGDRMNVLEEELTSAKADITDLKDHLNSVIKDLNVITDGLCGVKGENIEMRNQFNSMVKELNDIKRTELKKLLMTENEQTFETVPPPNKGYNLRSYVDDEDSFNT